MTTSCGADDQTTATSTDPGTEVQEPTGFDLETVTIRDDAGLMVELRVWRADSAEERGRGLMGVTGLGDAVGMLFVFDEQAVHRFYMWQTLVPLDIAFFDEGGRFVGTAEMQPCVAASSSGCERYAPGEPFRFAIEAPLGTITTMGIRPGAHLEIH